MTLRFLFTIAFVVLIFNFFIDILLVKTKINKEKIKSSNNKNETYLKESIESKQIQSEIKSVTFTNTKNEIETNTKTKSKNLKIKLILAILVNPDPINEEEENEENEKREENKDKIKQNQGILNSTNVDWLNETIYKESILEEIKKHLNLNSNDLENNEFSPIESENKNTIDEREEGKEEGEDEELNLKIEAEFVPLNYWQNESQIDEILNNVNGILYTGGDRNVNFKNTWEKYMLKVSNKILSLQEKGRKIPLIGICQGFELFHAILINSTKIYSNFDAWAEMMPTKFLKKDKLIDKKKSIFNSLNENEKNFLVKNNALTHYHRLGIKPEEYKKYEILRKTFQILSYGYDRKGEKFVDAIESLNPYNIYGVQFHPEKDPIIISGNTELEKIRFLNEYRNIMSKISINFFVKAVEDRLIMNKDIDNDINRDREFGNITTKGESKFIEKIKLRRSDRIFNYPGKGPYPIYLFSE
jgi:gamma-glutamyl-gamma-aminobutyrate hydrolase PuuD